MKSKTLSYNNDFSKISGFTLIEILTAITIMGILSAIAIPVYQNYTADAANKACLVEVKAYANSVLLAFNNNESSRPTTPINSACLETTDASSWLTLQDNISAHAKAPGTKVFTCNLLNGGNCE